MEGLLVMWLYYSGRLTMMGQFSVGVATFFRGLVEGGHLIFHCRMERKLKFSWTGSNANQVTESWYIAPPPPPPGELISKLLN